MGFGKDGKGAILKERVKITVGNLAADTGILSTSGNRISDALQDDFRIIKTEYIVTKRDQTGGEGTLLLGIADGELSLAEIEENIELAGPVDRNDRISTERAERPVWVLGHMGDNDDLVGVGSGGFQPTREKVLRWTFSNPEAWDWFVYNSGTILTAGTIVEIYAKHFGVWVT